MDFFIVAHSGSIVWFSPVCFVSKLGDFLLFFLAYRLGVFCSPPFGVEVFFLSRLARKIGFCGFQICDYLLLLQYAFIASVANLAVPSPPAASMVWRKRSSSVYILPNDSRICGVQV